MDQFETLNLHMQPKVERWSGTAAYQAVVHRPAIGSILVLKLDHIGDFILGFDALLALKQGFPEARMELLCAPWNVELARSLRLFDAVHGLSYFPARSDGGPAVLDDAAFHALRLPSFDLAVDLRIDADTRAVLRLVHASYKAGFDAGADNDVMTLSLPHRIPGSDSTNLAMHQSLLMLRLVRTVVDAFHLDDGVRSLLLERVARPAEIDLSARGGRSLVVCNTSSGRAVKNWPIERFRNTVRWLARELDVAVLLVGGPDQADEADDIINFCGCEHVMSAVGRTSIAQAVTLIAQADVYVANDSGLTHVAGRLGTPTVALFSGIDPTAMWATLGPNVILLRAPVACSPCHIMHLEECVGAHACVLNISEQSVRSAIRTHLFAAIPHPRARTSPRTASRIDSDDYRRWTNERSSQVPQRFSDNLPRYIAQGGELEIDALRRGFTASNENNRGDLNRFYGLTLILDQIIKEGLRGDVAELGVYKGNTATMLADLARRIGGTAYLLDTFEGFRAEDLEGVDANKRMEFSDTSLAQVMELVGSEATRFVQGYFPATASQIPGDATFCLVHIDCDLYAPFCSALEFFYDRLIPGGFLVMHDYSSLHWDGAERAVDEFFADKPESVVPMPDGSGTVIVRRSRKADRFDNWLVRSRTTGFANAWVLCNSAAVQDLLGSGWSRPEAWGVWGLGACHQLDLVLSHAPDRDLEFVAETLVPLVHGRTHMEVTISVASERLAIWRYDEANNHGIRVVRVPYRLVRAGAEGPALRLEFHPSSSAPPISLDPMNLDDRPLGLGLVRFRQREL